MKVKYLLVLILVTLLLAACGAQPPVATPKADSATAAATAAPTAAATVVLSIAPTPVGGPTIAATEPITPTGGVEVALAAIKPVEGTLATVNGEEITWADYEPELKQSLYGVTLQYGLDWNQAETISQLGPFQDDILQTVIDRTVLRQSAAREGIKASQEEIDGLIEEQKASVSSSGQFSSWEQFLEDYGLSEEYFARLMEDSALMKKVSDAHAPAREAEQVHARHILVADEETGKQVISRLEAGEAWATLASELSQDTNNKDSEGDLGWFPRGAMVPEFEEAAFALEPGKTSAPVQTDYGYHIIQVLEKGQRALDDDTYQSLVSKAFQTWLSEQKAAAETTIAVTFAPAE